jgi:hypothetical protein
LRKVAISIARPKYLDEMYLTGRLSDVYMTVLAFVTKCRVNVKVEIYLPVAVAQEDRAGQQWRFNSMRHNEMKRLEVELMARGVDCTVLNRM